MNPWPVKSLDIALCAYSKAAYLGVGVSALESTGIYPFNRNVVPECN
jgi:hypothetical protein